MEMQITKEVFKSQAKKQLAALKDRNVELKLSDIQESLAIAYGFENLATLYAKFKAEDYSVVDAEPLRAQKNNLFIVTWVLDADPLADEVMGIYPPGTTLHDVSARDWKKVQELNDKVIVIPEGMAFSEETVALHNYARVPNIAKYGLHDGAHYSTVDGWVKQFLGFRVPKGGVEIDTYDMADDGGSKDHVLIWLNDEDRDKVRALFAE